MDYSQGIINHIEHLKNYTAESISNVTQSIIPELLDVQWEPVKEYYFNNKRYRNFDPTKQIFKISNMRYYPTVKLKFNFTGYVSSVDPIKHPTDPVKPSVGELWYESSLTDMHELGRGVFAGTVDHNDTHFPKYRLDGTALQNNEYVQPDKNSKFPFTIEGITFFNETTRALYRNNVWILDDGTEDPTKYAIPVKKYNGSEWVPTEKYIAKDLDLWSNKNHIDNINYYWFEDRWLECEFHNSYSFRENAYLAYKHYICPAFLLFINGKMIPMTDITIIRTHKYSYFLIQNTESFKDKYTSLKLVAFPFNIHYTESAKTIEGHIELFRFDSDGAYASNGRIIYSANVEHLRVTKNSFAALSTVKNFDLSIEKQVKLFPKNVFLFKGGYFDLETDKKVANLNLLTLNNGEALANAYNYVIFYSTSTNPNISNILVPENDSYVKQVVAGNIPELDLSNLEEDFNFTFNPAEDYSTNINKSLKYIAEYRQSLLNDVLYKASDVVSYKYTGAEIKSKVKNGMLRMLRARHHFYDTYVLVYKNNEVYENYQYLYYEANAWYMPVDKKKIDDTDVFEIIYFNRVNNAVVGQKMQQDNRWITHCPFQPEELQISSDYMQHRLYNMTPSDLTRYKVGFTYEIDPTDKSKVIISLDDPNYYEPSIFTPNPDDFHCVNWTLHWDANNQLQFYHGSVLAMTLQAEGKLLVNDFCLPYDDDTEDFVIGNWVLHQTTYNELLFLYKDGTNSPYIAMTINELTGNLKCDSYSDKEDLTNPDESTYLAKVDIGNGWYLAEDADHKLRFGNSAKIFSPAVLYDREMFASADLSEKTMESKNYEPTENFIQIGEWIIYAETAFQLVIIGNHMSKVIIQADGTVYTLNDIDESYNTSAISYAGDKTGKIARIDKKHPVGKDWYLADDTKKMFRFMCHTDNTISVLDKPGKLYLNEMLNQNFAECYVDIHADDLKVGDWTIHYNDLGELMFVHQDIIPAAFNSNGEIRAAEYVDNEDLTNPTGDLLASVTIGNGWSIIEDANHRLRFVSTSSTSAGMMIHPEDWMASSTIEESNDNPIDYTGASENIIRVGDWAFYAVDSDRLRVLYQDLCYITIHSDGTITTINGLLENYVVHAITPYPTAEEVTIIGPWRIYAADADHLKFLFKDYCILTITSDSQYILPGFFTEYLNHIVKVKLIPQRDKDVKIYVDDKELASPMYVSRDKYVTIKAVHEDSISSVDLYIKTNDIEEFRGETLWLSSMNQFRYICYNNTKKNAAFDLSYDFRECLDVERYMVCINGKALNDTMFRIILPSKDTPFTEPCVHVSKMVRPGDRVEIFYLPCKCTNIDVNNFDKVTTEYIIVMDPAITTYDIPFPIPNYSAGRNGFAVMVGNKIIDPKEYTVENDKITFTSLIFEVMDKITFIFFYNENVTPETYDEEDLPNIEQYGYIYLDKNKLTHSLSKDLYFLFINGKKVDKDSILDITSNLFRVKRDIRSRTHVALMDHTVSIPAIDELCKVVSKYDIEMNRIAYEFLNKLFKKYNRVSDTDPRMLNDISQEALINDIVRYHYTSQAFSQSLPFIFTYDTKYYTNKDIYGNFIITTMDANKQNFPDYPHTND